MTWDNLKALSHLLRLNAVVTTQDLVLPLKEWAADSPLHPKVCPLAHHPLLLKLHELCVGPAFQGCSALPHFTSNDYKIVHISVVDGEGSLDFFISPES